MVVSGWQVYDNKGRVVEKYEPFFATGWDYAQPGEAAARAADGRCSTTRAARLVRTVNPDGSEQRVVLGRAGRPGRPGRVHPDPWETYTYDANDNAGRTHPRTRPRTGTTGTPRPASRSTRSAGRCRSVQRHREPAAGSPVEELDTRFGYDIRGNLVSLVDAAGRTALALRAAT